MPCPYCGVAMSGRRIRNCGAPECRRRWDADRVRAFLHRRKAETGVPYEDRYKIKRLCPDCGETFRSKPSHGAERCRPCQIRLWRMAGNPPRTKALVLAGPVRRAETLAYRRAVCRLTKAAIGAVPCGTFVSGRCVRCGKPYVCRLIGSMPAWCSDSCRRADAASRRRAARRSAHVRYSRHAVFERDRWTCQLCGKRVKRRAKVPDPKAPVIDHIVPLAAGPELGGVDAPWNVQCAHFLCNSIKSASFAQPALALEVA